MCIQSVLSATDLLHVPLEFLDQNLQFTDALVCFVSRTAKRSGLSKDQGNTNLKLIETFLHKLGWSVKICTSVIENKAQLLRRSQLNWLQYVSNRLFKLFYTTRAIVLDLKSKTKDGLYLACHVTVFLLEVFVELFQPLIFIAQQGVKFGCCLP